MIHSLFIIDKTGEIIIERHWRGRVSRDIGNKFWEEVKKQKRPEDTPPVISTPKHYLVHTYEHELFFVGVVHCETPPMMVTELLHSMVEIFEKYLGSVSEASIKKNFVTIYQLLDEMIDNGYPITTELSLLMDLVQAPVSLIKSVAKTVSQPSAGHGRSPVPWRKLGIRYTQNEIFFDIVEELNCIVDVNGMSAFAEIIGRVQVDCKLSGMPDLMLTFKDPTLIEDCSFHPCVRYARFEQDKAISFVPPDGKFELFDYRITTVPSLPLYCRPQVNFYEGGANVSIMAGLKGLPKNLEDVRVIIPLPSSIETSSLTCNQGSATYDAKLKALKWEIGKMNPQNKNTPSCNGRITFSSKENFLGSSSGAVQVQFKISTSSLSDVKVDSVQIKNEKYKPYKGVRYLSQSGRFEVRTV